MWLQINWSLVVVDEGQRLKNRKAQALQALRDLHISRRLLLSGTPLQNNTAELWTLMNFVEPVRAATPQVTGCMFFFIVFAVRGSVGIVLPCGLDNPHTMCFRPVPSPPPLSHHPPSLPHRQGRFASLDDFQHSYGDIQSAGQVESLAAAIKPHILRRLKARVIAIVGALFDGNHCTVPPVTTPAPLTIRTSRCWHLLAAVRCPPCCTLRTQEDVEKSIPKKEETIIDVELTLLQKQYYRAVFERNREFLCRPTAADGKLKGPKLLNLESQLRKCCNHPYLLEGTGIHPRQASLPPPPTHCTVHPVTHACEHR